MGHDSDQAMTDIAERIADGHPVDWDETGLGSPGSDPRLERLQVIERILSAHRALPSADAPRDGQASAAPTQRTSQASAAQRPSSPSTWGHLQDLEWIGGGSFGEVYRAFDPNLRTWVALKLLRIAEAREARDEERFLDEARRLARVRHQNVIVVHGADRHAGRVGFWSELLRGRTLEDSLAQQGRFGAREATSIGLDLCRALAAVHAALVIHRDVKASNVMREEGGRIVLMDLGSGGDLPPEGGVLVDEHLYGTPLAMAPEQLLGQVAGPATDIYGLGALLYRLVSRRYPVDGASLLELAEKHRVRDSTPLRDLRPDLPSDFIQVVEKATDPDPARRYQSAGAMERALEATLRGPALMEIPSAPMETRIPQPLSRFIGRRREIDQCSALLQRSRLLTLSGPGGCGKTRLALRLAEESRTDFPDGQWFVDLSPLTDEADVARAVATIMGAREEPGVSLGEVLSRNLREKRGLLILDNCEHVLDGSRRLVRALLGNCPSLMVLTTSRERLGIAGEQVYGVPPMTLPEGERPSAAMVLASESGQLFCDRATSVRADFELDEGQAPWVGEICRRLEGLPLALELAAARVHVVGLERLCTHLAEKLKVLTDGDPTAGARHRTLRGTMEWSYDLLSKEERELFQALSVFAGGWSIEAAAALCPELGDEFKVLELLGHLADKSLVIATQGVSETRYRFLEPIREFALEMLQTTEQLALRRDRHLGWFLALAESAEPHLMGKEQAPWFACLEMEHENMLAAHRWALSLPSRAVKGVKLASALYRFWYTRGLGTMGRTALENALSRAGDGCTPTQRAAGLTRAGILAVTQSEDPRVAAPLFQQALVLCRDTGDVKGAAAALLGLGMASQVQGETRAARAFYDEALRESRASGNLASAGAALNNLGLIAQAEADYESARRLFEESVATWRQLGDRGGIIHPLSSLCSLALRLGDREKAASFLKEALEACLEIEGKFSGVSVLEAAAELTWRLGYGERAAHLLGSSSALQLSMRASATPFEASERKRLIEGVRQDVGAELFESAWVQGGRIPFEAAIKRTVEWLGQEEQRPSTGPQPPVSPAG
jgi:predicted ATPase